MKPFQSMGLTGHGRASHAVPEYGAIPGPGYGLQGVQGAIPGIGHNTPHGVSNGLPMAMHATANIETGVLLLCKELFVRCVEDRRLHRAHLRILGFIASCMDFKSAQSSPSRAMIAEALKMDPRMVSNDMTELKKFGYLVSQRRFDQDTGSSKTFYTFGNIDHDTLRRDVMTFINRVCDGDPNKIYGSDVVASYRDFAYAFQHARESASKDKKQPKVANITPQGEVTSPPRVNITPQGELNITPQGEVTSPPRVNSAGPRAREVYTHAGARVNDNLLTSLGSCSSDRIESSLEICGDSKKTKPARGSRLPVDWQLPKSWGEWTLDNFIIKRGDVKMEADKFKDWALSAPGQKAIKLDWQATWRNWCRNSKTWKPKTIQPGADDLLDSRGRVGTVDNTDWHSQNLEQARREMGIGVK